MKNINSKLSNYIKDEKVMKWVKPFVIIMTLSAYFVAALCFQLIAHDKLSSSNLTVGTTLGFIGSTMIILSLAPYKHIDHKYGEDKSVWLIYSGILGIILVFVTIIIGPIGYLEFR